VVEIPKYITLIVSPQDAVTLNYLMYSGAGGGAALTLALRSAGDDTRIQTEAVTLQFLLDQYRIPVPVKLPYGMEPKTDRLVEPTPVGSDTSETNK
jgi:pilus assembly protein CpaB